jgi:hypothetical protein
VAESKTKASAVGCDRNQEGRGRWAGATRRLPNNAAATGTEPVPRAGYRGPSAGGERQPIGVDWVPTDWFRWSWTR